MAQSIESYIKDQWLGVPTTKIDLDSGEEYAVWLIENDADEYLSIAANDSIAEVQAELLIFKLTSKQVDIENSEMELKKLVASVFQESLIDAIDAYKNAEPDETELEGQSYDKQRMMR